MTPPPDDVITLLREDHRQLGSTMAELSGAGTEPRAVLAHAEREEAAVLPLLAYSVSADKLARMGGRYGEAKPAAPNHPHLYMADMRPGTGSSVRLRH